MSLLQPDFSNPFALVIVSVLVVGAVVVVRGKISRPAHHGATITSEKQPLSTPALEKALPFGGLPPPRGPITPPTTTAAAVKERWEDLVAESGGQWPPQPTWSYTDPTLQQIDHLARTAASEKIARWDVLTWKSQDIIDNRKWLVERLPEKQKLLDALAGIQDQNNFIGAAVCVTTLTHMYRWAVLPILREVQLEKDNHLPDTLKAAQKYVNGRLGLQTTGGCATTLGYYNYNAATDKLEYRTTGHFSDAAISTELYNTKMFWAMEDAMKPFYRSLVRFVQEVEAGIDSTALSDDGGLAGLKASFAWFFKNLKSPNLEKTIWSRYVQGFHGWSWDGFEGFSGGQAFMIRVIDAVLDIPAVSKPSHLTRGQREFVDAVRGMQLRGVLSDGSKPQAARDIAEILKMLKTWRMGHRKKAIWYQDQELPERIAMNGGHGTDGDVGLAGMLANMDARLAQRTLLTV
ncbi:unnamed protein product [Sympodiomycopsis kandeliae]